MEQGHKGKRLLALLLLLSLLCNLLPVSVVGAEEATSAATQATEEKPATKSSLAEENAAYAQELRLRLESLENPYNELVDMTGLDASPVLDGDFYIVLQANTGKSYALNSVKKAPQYRLGSTEVSIQDGRVTGGDYESILTLCPWENSSYVAHAILDVEGLFFRYVSVSGNLHFDRKAKLAYELVPNGSGAELRIRISATRIPAISHCGEGWFYLHEFADAQDEIVFQIFRLSKTAVLYRSFSQMGDYLHGNVNGTYPDGDYNSFLKTLEGAMDLYEQYNVSMCTEEATIADLERVNDLLLQEKSDLIFSNTATDYIDIPIEILDFRADTLLFEFLDTTGHVHRYMYDLYADKSALAGVPFPGTYFTSTIPAPDGGYKSVAQGLTYQELQNGELIYTEETIAYVAGLLMIDTGWQCEAFLNTLPGDDNRWFLRKIEALQKVAETDSAAALGSMTDTLSKTVPFTLNGVEGQYNGGILLSKDCSTAFDIAYYALNNIWRPVSQEDVLTDEDDTTLDLPYNTSVPERSRIRLYWDPAIGMYSFDAGYQVVYNGAYIYNTLPLKSNGIGYDTPCFMPIDGLGFEKPEVDEDGVGKQVETDRSTYCSTQGFGTITKDGNYHYTIHASGSFAYYEDQELYFAFLGDDDVYFFIDGKMVMDLGAAHQAAGTEFTLNKTALSDLGLDLKDGEIYSFDMFYAERHTTGSNMRFSTNMHIMETETLTTKSQYLVNSDGQEIMDQNTGLGRALAENEIMNIGDTVAYGFELTNLRDVTVEELSFIDQSLGTRISSDSENIVLTDSTLTNGAVTGIGDISLYYRSVNPNTGEINEAVPQRCSVTEMLKLIADAKNGQGEDQPLATGSYWVALSAETGIDDLKTFLAEGVPPMSQLMIYGFRRNMGQDDTPYVNTVYSQCSYTRTENSLVGIQQERIQINGSASRMLRVPLISSIIKPTVQKVQIVLDYGKPLQIPIASIKEKIYTESPVEIGSFRGITTAGRNGEFLQELPKILGCKAVGETMTSANGTYTRTGDSLEFRLSKMLSTVETVYAVFEVENYSVLLTPTQSVDYPYVLVELQLIPATMMYYETDFAAGIFKTEAVGTGATAWDIPENTTEEFQSNGYEKDQYPTEAAAEGTSETTSATGLGNQAATKAPATRSPVKTTRAAVVSGEYVLLDFDTDEITWDNVSMTSAVDTEQGLLCGNLTGPDPHISMNQLQLDYTLKAGDVLQFRVKVDLDAGEPRGYKFFLKLEGDTKFVEDHSIQNDGAWEGGSYQTLTLQIPESLAGQKLQALRYDPMHGTSSGSDATGTYELDYIFIGSQTIAPDDRYISSDILYFDFTNTPSDIHRYTQPQYSGINFDEEGAWRGRHYITADSYTYETTRTLDTNAGTFTLYPYKANSAGNALSGMATPLAYVPKNAEVLQLRVKLSNVSIYSGTSRLKFWYDGVNSNSNSILYYFKTSNFVDGEYQIITIPIAAELRQEKVMNMLRLSFHEFMQQEDSSITFDWVYLGPRNSAPYQEALYFDFTNTEADRQRYENEVYRGWNYDVENWYGTYYASTGNDPVTYGDGCISVETGTNNWTYVITGKNHADNNLHYIPTNAEVVALRFKIDDTLSLRSDSMITFDYLAEGSTDYVRGQIIPLTTDMHPEQGYITVKAKVTDEGLLNAAYLNGLKVNIWNYEGQGSFIIDYIYMGPEAGVPSDTKLFFDFKNTTADQLRYNTNTYGYHSDFDSNPAKWRARGVPVSFISGSETAMKVPQSAADSTGTWVEPNNGTGRHATELLSYKPSQGDVVQVRLRFDGLAHSGNKSYARLYYVADGAEIGTKYTALGNFSEEHFEGRYVTLTVPLASNFTDASLISNIRFMVEGMNSADGVTPGSVVIDYIYIGPEAEVPTPQYTVTYQDEKGNVLESQLLHKGEASVFHGTMPTKVSDANNHYSFGHWVTTAGATVDLNNITSDLTLKPYFVPQSHSWNNTITQSLSCTDNEITYSFCTVCSYEKTYVSTRATGHSFVNDICTVCGIGNTGSLLHFREGSPELKYQWTYRYQTTAPTFDTAGQGYMNGTYNRANARECYVGMNVVNPMHNIAHKIHSPDEIVQIRMKLTMSADVELALNSYRVYLHTSDMAASTTYNDAHSAAAYSVTMDQEGYAIINFPLPLVAVGNTIEEIRIDFFRSLTSDIAVTGTYSIDYIYFGPCCIAPVPEHTWDSGVVTKEPTCIAEGVRSHSCFLCGTTTASVEPITDHSYAIDKAVLSTCSTPGKTQGESCSICHHVKVAQEALPLIPHILSYTDNGDGFHTASCIHCTHSYSEEHFFTYGACRCGAKEPDYMVYGYDPSYTDDDALSNGTSLFVKGAGVTINNEEGKTGSQYTRATFSFTGTGFDLISRTGAEQATIRVVVYSDPGFKESSKVKSVTVNNKGELELYQIPVVSVQDLAYGTYYVTIGVNKEIKYTYTEEDKAAGKPDLTFLNRGDEFYFDAVRIYDPLNTALEPDGLQAYKDHYEAYPQITELRDLLLTAEEFGSATDSLIGAIFIDASKDNSGSHISSTIATYKDYGPKNETYLQPGQSVAFKLVVDSPVFPKSLDFGAKTIYGGKAVLEAAVGKAVPNGTTVTGEMKLTRRTTVSATAQFYSLSFAEEDFTLTADGKAYYTYVILTNRAAEGSANVLSVTDIKAAFDTKPVEEEKRSLPATVKYMVDSDAYLVADAYLRGAMEELPADPDMVIRHSLNLASDISVNYLVEKQMLAEYDSFYLECEIPEYEGNSLVGKQTVRLQPVERGSYYYFTLDGLTAVHMNDVIRATLRCKKDGWSIDSLTDSYSIGTYAYSQLNKVGVPQELKTLCADLLRYGAQAQSYKGYRTDALVDAAMTETHRDYLSDLEAVGFGNNNRELQDCATPMVKWAGKALNLDSKVSIRYVVDLKDCTATEPLSLVVRYTDGEGKEQSVRITELNLYNPEQRLYAFTLDSLRAAELRSVLTAAVYAGEQQISNSLVYSADTYGANKTGTLRELCKALFAYSDSARAYFTK